MGKSALLRLSALLMLVWYLACTAGFNLHTCLHSGETSVIAFAGVQPCSPEHTSCGCCSHCCSQEDADSVGTECCDDEFRTVYANAVLPERQSCPDAWVLWDFICTAVVPGHPSAPDPIPCVSRSMSMEDAPGYHPADRCMLYCVFRI